MLCLQSWVYAADVEANPGDDLAALTATLLPGDQVVLNSGLYVLPAPWTIASSGTREEPVVIRPAAGASPELSVQSGNWIVNIEGSHWLEIRGLTFRGAPGGNAHGGVRIQGAPTDNLLIDDCTFENLLGTALVVRANTQLMTVTNTHITNIDDGAAIDLGCQNGTCLVQDTEIGWNWIEQVRLQDDGHGIRVADLSHSINIHDNVISSVGGLGIAVGQTDFQPSNLVEGNALWDIGLAGIEIRGAATVRNNIVVDIDDWGVVAIPVAGEAFERVVISHNTIAGTTLDGIRLDGWEDRDGMVLANNVISNPDGLGLQYNVGDPDGEINAYISANAITGELNGLAEVPTGWIIPGAGEAEFDDAPGGDYYPSTSGNLVDAADAGEPGVVPETDFNGVERDPILAPDIGAFERDADANPGFVVASGFKPKPGDDDVTDPDLDSETGGCCASSDSDTALASMLFFLPFAGLRWRRRRRESGSGMVAAVGRAPTVRETSP